MAVRKSARKLEGRHRGGAPAWFFVLWFVLSVVGQWLASVLGSRWVGVPVVIALAVALTVAAMVWGPQTEVFPGGVRVREGRCQKQLTWDEVRSVDMPGRWEMGQDVHVRLRDGSRVQLPGLLAERWATELESYWFAHRGDLNSRADPPEADSGSD